MNNGFYLVLSAAIGALCGFLTVHSLFASVWWACMTFWAVTGMIVVNFSDRRSSKFAGATFGFFAIASWLISGFEGAPGQLAPFGALTLLLSLLGAACGAIWALVYDKLFRGSH